MSHLQCFELVFINNKAKPHPALIVVEVLSDHPSVIVIQYLQMVFGALVIDSVETGSVTHSDSPLSNMPYWVCLCVLIELVWLDALLMLIGCVEFVNLLTRRIDVKRVPSKFISDPICYSCSLRTFI